MTRPTFRRRNFFIKRGYQARFALVPILFLLLFLLGAGSYLYWYLKGFLELELYMPHSRLQNPWHEITPVLTQVALWGGAAFLVLLGAWVWRRFGALRRDLDRLADWMVNHVRGSVEEVPHFRDQEVEKLGHGLARAMGRFAEWDARVAVGCAEFKELAGQLTKSERIEDGVAAERLGEVRSRLEQLRRETERVRIDEGLS